MNIAVIPARGGSKRIPRKNIRQFAGRPIISWTIEKALQSACFDRVIVSTDDEEIASVAIEAGAEVPFERSADLSDDHTSTVAVIADAIDRVEKVDFACCIYPTAPMISEMALRRGLELLRSDPTMDYVMPIAEYPHPIQRSLSVNESGDITLVYPEHGQTRTQDLPARYHDAGQFYWGSSSSWLGQRPILGGKTRGVIVPSHTVVDIDTLDDWIKAEALFRAQQNESRFFVVFSIKGSLQRVGFPSLAEAVSDYERKCEADKLFDDRFVIGIEDRDGVPVTPQI